MQQNKFMSLEQAENLAKFLRKLRKPPVIGFANGCFDLFHIGHLAFLRSCKTQVQSGCLIVAVNTDTSVRQTKGDDRPVVGFERRIRTIEDLFFIDFVTALFDMTAAFAIRAIRPDIVFRGHDQISTADELVAIHEAGARVHPVEKFGDWSTTSAIAAKGRG